MAIGFTNQKDATLTSADVANHKDTRLMLLTTRKTKPNQLVSLTIMTPIITV